MSTGIIVVSEHDVISKWKVALKDLRFGAWTQSLPGYVGHCQHCETSWMFVEPHVVRFAYGKQVAALCEICHQELDIPKRRTYYAQLMPYWSESGLLTDGHELRDRLRIFKVINNGG